MIATCTVLLGLALQAQEEAPVRFNRDIRPLLAKYCLACHGPDEKHREGDLRLDVPSDAVVPGKPDASLVLKRVTATGKRRMPPTKTNKVVAPDEIARLRRWIAEGASYEGHWSFIPPRRAPLPEVKNAAWPRDGIDRFILARLESEGLVPAGPETEERLLRRVTLDLTGLPPTPAEVDAFLDDDSDRAYEKVVDRLLASPRYGERMALDWLDAARYADTHGLHVDSHREMWHWRDWVIAAFNRNLPFDRFTVEQLAGDLLDDPSDDQLIATGFNRNHLISYQGSAIEEKVRVAYIVDRVATTATVWMGLTMGCAQCHDHKFDPISQEEYYGFFAFFNTIAEKAKGGRDGNALPVLRLPDEAQEKELARLRDAITAAGKDKKKVEALRKKEQALLKKVPNTMIMREMEKPRKTFLLERGEYNQPGGAVGAHTPSVLPPLGDLPRTRLGLARWLVRPDHPLTARVMVNRLWQMLFGAGIVQDAGDFGTQGDWPSHPELLDRLAVDFVESGWDVKAMLKRMVMSATYRQSSAVDPELVERDPKNRLLARGPRFRLQAELIRDQALAAAGLLGDRIGGPSVKPYQPDGVWKAVAAQQGNYTAQVYTQDHGSKLYRRSLYTFWKRLAPPPAMLALDAPRRDVSCVRRQRTNTPLQALVVMNDPTFVEAGRVLAERMMKEGGKGAASRLEHGFRLVTSRRPTSGERELLLDLFERQRDQFRQAPAEAKKLLGVGEKQADGSLDPAELAAWATVAGVLLNLDETLTKG